MSEQARADLLLHTGNQRGAADPGLSAWVAANAGSGKTSVLVDRVTRLLLAGTRPGGILCLTFTKAAAAEMAIRLNKRLAAWALLPEDKLRDALTDLLSRPANAADLDIARRLFARTLEAPGGLRLQTVHAFCEALLKRFPVEAGVPPHFNVADDARAAALLHAARETVLRQASQDAALNDALLFLAERLSDGRFADLLKALLNKRRDLALWLEAEGGAEGAIAALAQELDLPAGVSRDGMLQAHRRGLAWDDLRRAVAALAQGGKKDTDLAAILAPCLEQNLPPDLLADQWLPAFFTAKGEPTKTLAYKESLKLAPDADDVLKAEQQRLMLLRDRLNALAILEASAALLRIGEQLLAAYAAAKRREGLLDYDDLILRSRDLLVEPTRVAWVMFKLDQGIDHILVDEAQDTSPDQWRVIEALAEDFFTGAGARPGLRTVFAVGDVKQSIYSFQGARPKTFLAMRDHFRRAAEAAEASFRVLPLQMSFRSTPAVLRLVDEVFAVAEAKGGVVEPDDTLLHRARRAEAPGRVDLWPALAPPALEQPEAWDAPLDYIGADDPRITLARRIAAQVKGWLGREWLPGQGRMLTAGDVMILVRRRNAFFDAMVRELKLAGVPVAGADRMQLAEQMAVLDLLALGHFCVLPDDDLTLATVLKGPLFNFSEEDLFALCHERPATLWRNLRERADEQLHWRRALDELGGLLLRADRAPPFAFYAELLGAGGGRRRLLARLGREADEPIDEFLAACIHFEREEPPSLQGFLAWFDDHAGEIKRDLEQGRDEVRVLTVHGAKGLEAPVVILPDTCDLPVAREDEGLLWREAGARDQPEARPALFWPPRKEFDVPLSAALRQARQLAQREEYRRLLYVALTRAQDRLIVAGYLNGRTVKSGPAPESWYSLVQTAFDRLPDVQAVDLPWGDVAQRFENAGQDAEKPKPRAADRPVLPLPAWSQALPPAEPVPALPLAPSRPAREPAPPPSPALPRNRAGLQRGRLVHRLLQSLPDLPAAEQEAAASRFLAHPGHDLTPEMQAELRREVLAVLAHPAFAPVFSAEARVEAPLAGMVGEQIVVGRVDRLIVMPDQVLVLDYKTDRPPPAEAAATDPAYLRQMALYTELLRGIFPQHEIVAALLWTHAPALMPLPPALLAASLHRDSPRATPNPSLLP
ncbi:double-strand break repair helicase AddA [Ferrovibrio sp.]|uniref:double-strand break repair helicase AddA n=1 Tax=Ferrovibrio sp. TaxID=1917215 RepID=UPI001B50CFEA|nr:double-strand break repair helicase AddA [Ferrovibrio sp.]MBP7064104.1 double-strand break repair helicase AddA [Ferrovibrio sp.]